MKSSPVLGQFQLSNWLISFQPLNKTHQLLSMPNDRDQLGRRVNWEMTDEEKEEEDQLLQEGV